MPSTNRRISVGLMNMQVCLLVLLSAATVLMSGCGKFFTCEGKASCSSSGGGSTGGAGTDVAYVANSATGSTYLDAYDVSSGALTAVTGSPFSLNYVPTSAVITPADTYMYIASDAALNTTNPGDGYIYGYSVGTGGSLSILGGGSPLISENDAALAISPDGKWLFTLPDDAIQINEYPITSSTGLLGTLASFYGLSSAPTGVITPLSIAVAPSGAYFAAALGTGGANVFPFDTTTGTQTTGQSAGGINPGSSSSGIYAVGFDSNNYLYCAATAGLEVFSMSSGSATFLQTYPLGNAPRSIAISSGSTSYIYVGNEADSTISGYSIGANAVLTALPGSPYAAPASVAALAIDSSGKYVIASGYDASTGIQLYSIGSDGALTSTASGGDGTSDIPSAIATTH